MHGERSVDAVLSPDLIGEAVVVTSAASPLRGTVTASLDHGMLAEQVWDGLVSESETGSVFQTRAWHRSWWAAFGEAYEPRVVVVCRGLEVVGLAPFVVDRRNPHVLRFMGDGRADYCDIITRRADKRPVLEAMFDALETAPSWSIMELNNLPSSSGTVAALRDLCRRAGYGLSVEAQFVCPTLRIQGNGDSARKIFNKPSLRRPETVLARAGQVTYRTLTGDHEVMRQLEPFFEQHIDRWSQTATPSLFMDTRNREFYRALAAGLGPKGWLHFSMVEFEGQPIAFHFGFDFGGVLTWYKPSFAMAYAARSPGMVLLRHLIGDAIAGQRAELDFTVGDEPFKRRFTNSIRHTERVRIYREPSSFLLERARRAVREVVKRMSQGAPIRRPEWRREA